MANYEYFKKVFATEMSKVFNGLKHIPATSEPKLGGCKEIST